MKNIKRTKVLAIFTLVVALTGIFIFKWFDTEKHVSKNKHPLPEQVPLKNTNQIGDNKLGINTATHNENNHVSRNPSQETVAEDIFADLELPAPFSKQEAELMLVEFSATQVYRHQDEFIKNYPLYSKIRDQIVSDISKEIDIDNLSTPELISHALKFRNGFWEEGGNLSSNAYLNAYKARSLLESAYMRDPNNLSIGDELVETIQSTHARWFFAEKGSDKKVINTESQKQLLEIRTKQFGQIKTEITNGRRPKWQDFERTCDLAVLLVSENKDFEQAKEVIEWQINHANDGNWTDFETILRKALNSYNQKKSCYFNIYKGPKNKKNWPQEFRYGRRLPSFKGPDIQKRGRVPISRYNSNLKWISDEDIRR